MQTADLLKLRKYTIVPPVVAGIVYVYFLRQMKRSNKPSSMKTQPLKEKKIIQKVGVNRQFVDQMKKLLPILIPKVFCRETGLLVTLAAALIARTYLDIFFSTFNSQVVRTIVTRDYEGFFARAGIQFAFIMWPMSIVNNSMKLLINELALSFRARLVRYAHEQYLDGLTFYRVANIDNRIQNADQLLTQDIDKFADNLAHLYTDTLKPIIDIFLFAFKLGEAIGLQSPVIMVAYFVASGAFLRTISPPFGKYTAEEQRLEGDFRFTHSRIITASEEIAFYKGNELEKSNANDSFNKIVRHLHRFNLLKYANGIIDSVVVKYCATVLAYFLLSRPVFDARYATEKMGSLDADPTELMEQYTRNSSYLVNLSQAVGRVILAGRDLTKFAGYASRVAELFEVLEDVQNGKYVRSMQDKNDDKAVAVLKKVDKSDLKGTYQNSTDGSIEFINVPILTPAGDSLINSMTFKVTPGQSVLVTGANGAGKSSLFRVLAELWPLFDGQVKKPKGSKIFFVPQKPYLAIGTLRDQIIYPDTYPQALAKGVSDRDLKSILQHVALEYLVDRQPDGFNLVENFADTLSGGEKQRMGFARLLYHRPAVAVLDEASSQVSADTEGAMYTRAKELGMTLFTVSHRSSLFKYHEYLLRFDGEGQYTYQKLSKGDDQTPFAFAVKK